MKSLFFVAALGMSVVSAPLTASAATIVYSFSGNYSGSKDGSGFSGPATLTGIGDTDSSFDPDSAVTAVTLSSLTLTVNNASSLVGGSNVFFVNRSAKTGGFALLNGNSFRTLLLSDFFATYDGKSAVSSILGSAVALPYNFSTSTGDITVSAASNVRFAAETGVPEPSSWIMMMIGFGAVGYAMRRKTVLRYV